MKIKKPYTLKDFEAEKDMLERLRMCLIQNEFFTHLKDHEMRYFTKLYQTFGMVYDAKNLMVEPAQIVKNGMDVIARNTAEKYVQDMREVFEFGSGDADKVVHRNAMAQFHWELAQKAKELATTAQDLDFASRIAERSSRLLQLDKVKEGVTRQQRKMPTRIILSSDPSLLNYDSPENNKEDDDE